MTLTLSDVGRRTLAALEGCRAMPYPDVAGYWTIGIGHRLTPSENLSGKIVLPAGRVLRWKDGPLRDEQVQALLAADLASFEMRVRRCVKRPLTQGQYDALLCFAFNVGVSGFEGSTLLTRLNAGDYAAVPGELRRWVHAGGRVVEGLRRRREREVALWEGRGSEVST